MRIIDTVVPSATLLEFDLELKTHGIPGEARTALHSKLARVIPRARVLPLLPIILARATELSKSAAWRDSYFDTMIAATALEIGPQVTQHDRICVYCVDHPILAHH